MEKIRRVHQQVDEVKGILVQNVGALAMRPCTMQVVTVCTASKLTYLENSLGFHALFHSPE